MDRGRKPEHHKPGRGTNRPVNMDGFIVNRRGRSINEPFAKKVQDVNSITGQSKDIGQLGRQTRSISSAPQAPAAVAWTPRLQDPGTVALTRKSRRRAKKAEEKKWGFKRIAKKSGLTVLVVALIVIGFLGFKFFHNIDKVFGGNIVSNIGSLFDTTTLKGESNGRVNILLAGDSADDPNHQGAQLTDSILILSINTKTHTAFLLSIPRDLWVYVPGLSSYQKINAANDVTSFSQTGYPNGGMGQLEQIVSTDLGVPIDYYGLMDYSAFRDAVDAVGGVSVNIQSPDPRGLYDPNTNLKLPNGWVSLNGQQALNLARARGDGYGSYGFPDSDFNRTQHQRQLFIAVGEKAKSLGVITNPVKVSDLFNTLGNNLQTDLSLADVLRLIQLTKGINPNNVQSYSYSSTLTGNTSPILTDYTDPKSGQEAIIPTLGIGNYNQMQLYYEQLVSNNPIIKEGANVVILNGGNTVGLAKNYENSITKRGIDVTSIADSRTVIPQTEIMDNSNGKDPSTKKLLESTFGTNIIANDPTINASNASFVIILGVNQGQPSSSN